jgi:hypothetical protein
MQRKLAVRLCFFQREDALQVREIIECQLQEQRNLSRIEITIAKITTRTFIERKHEGERNEDKRIDALQRKKWFKIAGKNLLGVECENELYLIC